MAKLARHLQESFAEACPTGWDADVEVPLFDGPLRRRLGFQAHCDVRFHQPSSGRSIWVELEISRADPVANHIKFAVGHVEGRLDRDDTFVSMCSNHITPGRRSLAAHAIGLMRRIGMRAVQADLLPDIDGPEIKRLNHLEPDALRCLDLPVDRELDRIFAVAIPRPVPGQGKLMLAPGRAAVQLNIRRWNEDMAVPALREAWGKRTISYFVHDVTAGLFAPSKFAAYTLLPQGQLFPRSISIADYVAFWYDHPKFDGHVARRHLERNLVFRRGASADLADERRRAFEGFLERHADCIGVHPRGAFVLW